MLVMCCTFLLVLFLFAPYLMAVHCFLPLYFIIQASANADYVDFCLDALVYNFMPPATAPRSASYLDLLKQPWGLSKKTQVLDRVHSTLKNISNVVPLSPLRLEKIVRDRMPNIYTKEPVRSYLGFLYI